jgi:RNA recognition motif 2
MLLEEINVSHEGTYDFFYLPIDFKNKCNVGYCFINFLDPKHIVAFVKDFNGLRWKSFNSEKVCAITFARIQGKSSMVSRFQNSSLLEKDDEYRPLLFFSSGPDRGKPEPFPSSSRSLSSQTQTQTQTQILPHLQTQQHTLGPGSGSNTSKHSPTNNSSGYNNQAQSHGQGQAQSTSQHAGAVTSPSDGAEVVPKGRAKESEISETEIAEGTQDQMEKEESKSPSQIIFQAAEEVAEVQAQTQTHPEPHAADLGDRSNGLAPLLEAEVR